MTFELWYIGQPHRGVVFGSQVFDCCYFSLGARYDPHGNPSPGLTSTWVWQMFDQTCSGFTERYVCEIPANAVVG